MGKQNRCLGGAVVVGAVVIAACFGGSRESSTTQLVVAVDQNPVSFGTVTVNTTKTTSTPIVVRPQNSGDDDTITSITESCSDFSLLLGSGFDDSGQGAARVYCTYDSGGTTYGSGACQPVTFQFNAQFTPAGPGTSSCQVQIAYTSNVGGSSGTYQLMLTGTGQAAVAAMAIQPTTTITYTGIQVGAASSPQTVRITNTGSSGLTVSGSNNNPTVFAVSGNLASHALAPGMTENYAVTCTPPGVGTTYTGMLTFTTVEGPLTRAVSFQCTGINSSLVIGPNPGSFASTVVGQEPVELTLTITNTGDTTTIDDVRLGPTGLHPDLSIVQSPQGQGLGSGSATTVRLQYLATTAHAEGPLGTLIIGDTGSVTDREITITGEALVGAVGTSPAFLEFGPVCVGSSKSMPVEVYASAAAGFQLTSVTAPAAPFAIDAPAGRLEGNHANVLTVNATAAPTEPGEIEGSFLVNTDLPADAIREVKLSVIALPSGVAPTPELVHFGPVRVGMTTVAQEIVLTNCGETPVTISNLRIQGGNAAEFSIVSAPPSEPVNQMSSTTFLVVMQPRTNGTKLAQLAGDLEGGGSFVATFDGNAFGGDDDLLTDRGTYYACSAGGGAGAAPLALVLLGLCRRRRRA